VKAHLFRHTLLRVEPWDLLRARFGARTFDASLLGKTALADAAIEALGPKDPDPAPAGVLTAESVWRVVLEDRLGIQDARPDVRAWLEWSRDSAFGARWRTLSAELKKLLAEWIAGYLGDWAPAFVGCLDSGYGQQAMSIGLALGVLRLDRTQTLEDAPRVGLAQASGRIEQYTGGRALSARAQRVWNEAAEQWAATRASAGDLTNVVGELAESDRIIEKTGALSLAWIGKWSIAGFAQRLERFSAAVAASVDFKSALSDLQSHELSRRSARERSWARRALMAARLARWLATPDARQQDWSSSVLQYVEHGAWVDWARQTLAAGDEPEATAMRWTKLCDRSALRRDAENRSFGRLLASTESSTASAASFGASVIPVEQILERVVAPWAKERVLMVLMDGMSLAVWRELYQEFVVAGVQFWSLQESRPLPPGMSASHPQPLFRGPVCSAANWRPADRTSRSVVSRKILLSWLRRAAASRRCFFTRTN
jgi:hypothetical protein